MTRRAMFALLALAACKATEPSKMSAQFTEFSDVEADLKAALAPIRVGTRFDKALKILKGAMDFPHVYVELVTKSEMSNTGSYMYEVSHTDGHLKTRKTLLLTVRWKVNQLDGVIVQVTRS